MQFGGKRINLDPEPEENHFLRNLVIALLCIIAYLIWGARDDNGTSSNIQYSSETEESPYHQADDDDHSSNVKEAQNNEDNNSYGSYGNKNKDSKQPDNNVIKAPKAMDQELQKMNPHVH